MLHTQAGFLNFLEKPLVELIIQVLLNGHPYGGGDSYSCWSSQDTMVDSPVIHFQLCYTYNRFFLGRGKVTVVISFLGGIWLILGISMWTVWKVACSLESEKHRNIEWVGLEGTQWAIWSSRVTLEHIAENCSAWFILQIQHLAVGLLYSFVFLL